MPITVRNSLTDEDIRNVIQYFNSNASRKQFLEVMSDRKGFYFIDRHGKKRSVFWKGRLLVNYFNIPGFEDNEEYILYKSLCFVLGENNVHYYASLSCALAHSPTTTFALTGQFGHSTIEPLFAT